MPNAPAQPLPPPPWQRAPRRSGARRRDPLTQEAIVETALRLLDAEGLDGLTMRRVAEELDTGPASLYWHVGSKDGLLDLLMDHVIGEQEVPDSDPERWREQLKDVARTMRETILRHRDIVRISIGRVPLGPNALRYSERVLAILRAGGMFSTAQQLGGALGVAIVGTVFFSELGHRSFTGAFEHAMPVVVTLFLAAGALALLLPRTAVGEEAVAEV